MTATPPDQAAQALDEIIEKMDYVGWSDEQKQGYRAALLALMYRNTIDELENLIKGAYVTDFTKMIQARANELKAAAQRYGQPEPEQQA